MRVWLATLALLAQCVVAAPTAPPDTAIPRALRIPDSAGPGFSVYTSRDGLSDEIWSTVGIGPDGFVWAGSASSLARFDGYRWSPPPLPPGHSLVRDMATDAEGKLWAIFESEGLMRFDGKRWQQVGPARFYQRFSSVGSGAGKELWAAHNQGLATLVAGQWREDPGNPTIRQGRAIAYARTEKLFGAPREWLASADNGLWFRPWQRDPGPWQRFEQDGVRNMSLTDLMVSQDGGEEELWVVSYGSGVARLRNDGTRIWRAERGELPSEAIYSAVETRSPTGERSVWMASRGGLLRFRGDQVDVFNRRHGLPSDAVRGLKVLHGSDGTNALWLATEGGLARATLSASPWQPVSLIGATENGTFGVLVEDNDRGGERLWVGSAKEGLAMLDDGQWRRFNAANGSLPPNVVRGIWRLAGADGRPHRLLSLVGAPLHEIGDDLVIRALPTPWPLPPDAAVSHMLSRKVDGAVEWWAATNHAGVHRLRDRQWQAFPTIGTDARTSVAWLLEHVDRQGRSWLWAADNLGIARFDGKAWQRLPASLGLPNDGFRSLTLVAGKNGPVLWASSTHHGILRLDVSDPVRPRRLAATGLPAPPDPTIYSVLPDSAGRLYVCTNNGVQQLTPLAEGGYSERVFHRRDGLVHDECNTNSQFVDRHDRYWVGTLGGLGMFDPDTQPAAVASRPKRLHVTDLRLGNEGLSIPDSGRITFPASRHDLRIEYSLLTGQRESETRYRTHLLGFDDGVGEWTTERSRSFSTLPPGDYRLRIEAEDFSGTRATPVELAISVSPMWWQSQWLRIGAVVLVLLLALALVRHYNRRLRLREKLLRQQVAERTQDLHSANLRLTELSYLDPLTGIANRRRLLEAMRGAIERAVTQGKPMGLIVADVDHFKQYNDRHGHLAGDAALRAIAAAMNSAMREQDMVARFGGEEFACLMVDANLETVTRVAERMRALIEALPPRSLGNDTHTLTISAGVVSCIPGAGQSPEDLLHVADLALYQAKAAGRNQVRASQA